MSAQWSAMHVRLIRTSCCDAVRTPQSMWDMSQVVFCDLCRTWLIGLWQPLSNSESAVAICIHNLRILKILRSLEV